MINTPDAGKKSVYMFEYEVTSETILSILEKKCNFTLMIMLAKTPELKSLQNRENLYSSLI